MDIFKLLTGTLYKNNAGTVTTAYQLTVSAITDATEGSPRGGAGVSEPDESFIIVPLSPTEAGNVTGATNAWRDITGTNNAVISPDGASDSLAFVSTDNTIIVEPTESANAGRLDIRHGDTSTASGTSLTASTGMIINQINIDANGHIQSIGEIEEPMGGSIAVPSYSFSGGSSIPGDADPSTDNTHTHTISASGFNLTNVAYTLTGNGSIDGTTGVVTLPDNLASGSYTVRAQGTFTEIGNTDNTGSFDETHAVAIHVPYYVGRTTQETAVGIANARNNRRDDAVTARSHSFRFDAGSSNTHIFLNLPNSIYTSQSSTSPRITVNSFPVTTLFSTTGSNNRIFNTYYWSIAGTNTITIN